MLVDLLPLLLAAALGLALQRWSGGERLRSSLWQGNYVLVLPAAAIYAFLALDLDRGLVVAIALSLAAWWATVGISYGWARIVAPTRARRAALTLIGAFPNTGFIGYPLAQLAYGRDGLRLAVVYDQVSLVVPAIVVATIIARTHAATDTGVAGAGTGAPPARDSTASVVRRQLLLSPPLWTVLVLVALRLTLVREPIELDLLGDVVGHVVGPLGFLLLGLSLPLHGFSHDRREVLGVTGASIVRLASAPLLLALFATLTDTRVPAALYLVSALPTAFHTLVIARLHALEVATVRLGIVVTTVVGVVGVLVFVAVR